MSSEQEEIEALAAEIFGAVEFDQGKGFVSDGLGACRTRTAFFTAVRGHLSHTESAARKMRAFLRKHGQIRNQSSGGGV